MTATVTAGAIMDRSAALLNDAAKSIFTYAFQLPYLKTALDELQSLLIANNIQVSNEVSSAITVAIGTTVISFSSTPALPSDLVVIQELLERASGSTDDYLGMTRVEFLPEFDSSQRVDSLIYWTFQDNQIRFVGALTARQVKIRYISNNIAAITDESSTISVINAINLLAYRTAGLCARFMGENPERADALDAMALRQTDEFLSTNIKDKQVLSVRRRPFRAGWRNRFTW